jgi:imidazolonepropionase-like amidohydrolase
LVGTVEVGKEADLLVARGGPLVDIPWLGDVVHMVRAGLLIARS